jgi:archaellum component FlaF (FlaF/FlaG flagellin family)
MPTPLKAPNSDVIVVVNGPVVNDTVPMTYWFPSIIYSVSMANGMIVTSPDKYPTVATDTGSR